MKTAHTAPTCMMCETSRAIFYRCGRILLALASPRWPERRRLFVFCATWPRTQDAIQYSIYTGPSTKNGGDGPVRQKKYKKTHWRRNTTHTQNSNILDTRARISVICNSNCCVFYGRWIEVKHTVHRCFSLHLTMDISILEMRWDAIIPAYWNGFVEWWNGGMAEWQNSGMVEWQNGGMAEWQNGRMAEWWNGRMAEWEWRNSGITEGCNGGNS